MKIVVALQCVCVSVNRLTAMMILLFSLYFIRVVAIYLLNHDDYGCNKKNYVLAKQMYKHLSKYCFHGSKLLHIPVLWQ